MKCYVYSGHKKYMIIPSSREHITTKSPRREYITTKSPHINRTIILHRLIKDLMRSKNTSGYFSFYVDNISIKTYST